MVVVFNSTGRSIHDERVALTRTSFIKPWDPAVNRCDVISLVVSRSPLYIKFSINLRISFFLLFQIA